MSPLMYPLFVQCMQRCLQIMLLDCLWKRGDHMILEYVGSSILTIYIHDWLHARPRSLNDLMTWLPLFA